MKAYTQGTVDYFCGVYAVINACRYAVRAQKKFTYNEGCLFYQHLMDYLFENNQLKVVLHRGTYYELFEKLLVEAIAYLHTAYGLSLVFKKPYAHTEITMPALLDGIRAHLDSPASACVLRIHSRVIGDHWTTAVGVSRKNVRLADSYGFASLPVSKICFAPHKPILESTTEIPTGYKPPTGSGIYLLKKGVFLLNAV